MIAKERLNGARKVSAESEELPSDIKSEEKLIGSIMVRQSVLDEVLLVVNASQFYDETLGVVFAVIVGLHQEGKPVDEALVLNRLRARGVKQSGAVLARCLVASPTCSNAVYYAENVRDAAWERAVLKANAETKDDVLQSMDTARDKIGRAEQRITSIADMTTAGSMDRGDIKAVLTKTIDRIERRKKSQEQGLKTDYKKLDDMTGGLRAGELVILAGRTSMGKSAFAVNVASNVALAGYGVLIVSLEMSQEEIGERLICSIGKVNSDRVRTGMTSYDETVEIMEASEKLQNCPLVIDDAPSRSVTEISALARRVKRQQGLGLVVVDYVGLVKPDNPKDPRQEQVAQICRRLKNLARELKCCVLALAQLNRETVKGNDNRPKLHHLRESGSLEQDADVVLFVHRPDYYQGDKAEPRDGTGQNAEVIVAKQRNGPVGTVDLLWFGQYSEFRCPAKNRDESEAKVFYDGENFYGDSLDDGDF